MKKLLFVCSQNRLRSPTAEAVFSQWPGVEAMSAGLNSDAITPVSTDLLEWADIVVVMEEKHKNKLSKKFSPFLKDKRVVVLGIPDEYDYMQPELIQILKAKVLRYVGLRRIATQALKCDGPLHRPDRDDDRTVDGLLARGATGLTIART